ncbi:DUF2130 domain-containing protein [Wenyingzhuangia sp. 2_MG-2023]|uniref:DUF2130 domain-containing protein n=1 Tax=Wenyingzhuangia sp. 2_MG-2023 TaxID=3062639 RepID=UPI0026E19FF7|nr:DUF2130 domain-containing protein [Wenyingzhuangia sp. 2_MG-2023]MDO6738610.1 DUF2130 domain-containing protein [Wenyingzhuangia sp. 2_MG-2023]
MSKNTSIKCPDCGSQIDVNDILKHQLEEVVRGEFQEKQAKLVKEQKEREFALQREKEQFEAKKQRENELFKARLEKQSKEAEIQIEKKLKSKLEADNLDRIKAMQNELLEKSEKVKDLLKKEAEIEKLKRDISEVTEQAKLEAQKELSAQLQTEKEKIKRLADESNELKLKELQKQLDDQKKLTEEMKRKQEQGSMQLQGEVMELAIEEWLANQFPLDTIDEIKKGATGADCLQTVNTREQINCGTIYYESKRTKAFQPAWIDKFKNDIRDKGANIGVLVTEVMPSDLDRMGMKDGIWICTYEEFKGLCAVLRQSIIQWSRVLHNQENKGDKMSLLYDFLTSNEFRLQMEGIVEGFTQMQMDLQKEKNAMARLWKQREKQIDKVVDNAINMHASIRGIAGNAIQSIAALELPEDNVLELDE